MTNDFVDALESYVKAELRTKGIPADYNNEAVEIVDARNHLFRNAGCRVTDEADNIYALRDLCCIDEESMEMLPDRERIRRVARNYF